jgi:anhydro-N-acetylmuramic acid kinase
MIARPTDHPLVRLLGKRTKRVVGLMSGTSLDGVDAALVEVEGFGAETRASLQAFRMSAYTDAERATMAGWLRGDVATICDANARFGERLATAALDLIAEAGLQPADIDLIGSHGQTVWHHPPSQGGASTLQIGEPAVIAARTGVVTVGDFRVADVAVGGEGAPLLPWCDWALFRKPNTLRALQNIGGIANLGVVGDRAEDVLAFDQGPGNMMIDALAQWASGESEPYDRDGSLSARGRVQDDVLAWLLDDDYLRQRPPKSTGRERYGVQAVDRLRAKFADRSPHDLLATAVAFTAQAIARSYRAFLPRLPDEVLVSGGGAHNRTLLAHLERLLAPVPVRRFDAGGISPDAKEAVAFAVFAVQALHAEPANLRQVTGARLPAVLGKICLPPRSA